MRIRRARESEAAALSELAVISKQYWGYSPQDIEQWRPLLAVSAQDIASKPAFVAEVEDEAVGFYLLFPGPQLWELDHLWVSPEFARRGIGRALLVHAANSARRAGASTIVIDADPNAEPFYVACGAIRQGVVAAPIAGNPARVRPQLSLRVSSSTGWPTAKAYPMNLADATVVQLLIPVEDFERAVVYYRDVLGIKFLFAAPPQMAFFLCGAVRLLVGVTPPGQVSQRGSAIYFQVEDIQGVYSSLKSAGVHFVAEPHVVNRTPRSESWLAEFRDPDGNQLSLMSEVVHAGA